MEPIVNDHPARLRAAATLLDDEQFIALRGSSAVCRDAADEMERLRGGLDAAIRAAKLALFVINKQGVMPNSSWESGFKQDLATATAARGDEQTGEKSSKVD